LFCEVGFAIISSFVSHRETTGIEEKLEDGCGELHIGLDQDHFASRLYG
jgi:hypothetical protein